MNLTDTLTARYEYERRSPTGARSEAKRAANVLLDSAWQTAPSSARRALHIAMYAQRIGSELGAGSRAGRLWMQGLLSVLAPNAQDDYAVFARYGADEWSARILPVAHAFESAVETFGADAGASPADAMRYMMRHCERFDVDVVLALRRALGGAQAVPAVKARQSIATN